MAASKAVKERSLSEKNLTPEEAATIIQAGFRGFKTRRALREQAQAGIDLSDPAVIQAIVRIQAALRGHLTRRELHGAS